MNIPKPLLAIILVTLCGPAAWAAFAEKDRAGLAVLGLFLFLFIGKAISDRMKAAKKERDWQRRWDGM